MYIVVNKQNRAPKTFFYPLRLSNWQKPTGPCTLKSQKMKLETLAGCRYNRIQIILKISTLNVFIYSIFTELLSTISESRKTEKENRNSGGVPNGNAAPRSPSDSGRSDQSSRTGEDPAESAAAADYTADQAEAVKR